jgi:hypothetical protein
MSTFYVLPPREVVEHRLAEFLATLLPDLPTDPAVWRSLVETVTAGRDVFVIHREELPGVGDPLTDLVEGYGATYGDRVVEATAAGWRGYAVPQTPVAR